MRLQVAPARVGCLALALMIALAGNGLVSIAQAQAHRLPAPVAGLVETGAPLYTVRTQEALGLSVPPTDIHRLPDGRILIFAGQEFAFGDGARWEIFHQAPDDVKAPGMGVAIGDDGQIYMGVPAGFARVEFDANMQWRLEVVAPWSAADGSSVPVLRYAQQVAGEWFWHSGTGAVFSWRPGENARFRGRVDAVESVLHLGDAFYLSDHTSGRLWRLGTSEMEAVAYMPSISVSETLTCGVPLSGRELLVGTYARGLQVFDGAVTRRFGATGALTGDVRINDLCATANGFFAAAVEDVGIVFFDREGRTLQVLDRALDHRLSHVIRLIAGRGGEVWGQVSDGILRVEFPARVSNFEPLIGSSLTVAHPDRADGRLWVMTDGRIHRGLYDAAGRLTRFAADTPPDRFAYAFSCAMGIPVVGTDRGAYYHDEAGWHGFFPLSANLRILDREPQDGRWLYAAVGEVGWLRPAAGGIEVERIPVSGLGNLYNAVAAADGTIWFELGNSRVGRVRLIGGGPVVDFFDRQDGLPEGWVNLFRLGEHVGFNVEGHILRFDEGTHHFTPDAEFARQFPDVRDVLGRPARDAGGRVWMTANGTVRVFEHRGAAWHDLQERIAPGLLPNFFTMQDDGVVWLHAERRLARFDPALPQPPPVPLQALVTHVTLTGHGRTIYHTGAVLPPLAYSDNSLIVHFVALGSPFTAPVHFDVRLEGSGDNWISAGGGGSAAFNRLKEGNYVLHVRPRSGGTAGTEATLAFTVRAPWYRTTYAYIGYAGAGLVVFLLAVSVATFITRREKRQLHQFILERTRQLADANARLAAREKQSPTPVPPFVT